MIGTPRTVIGPIRHEKHMLQRERPAENDP